MKSDISKGYWFNKFGSTAPHSDQYRSVLDQISEDPKTQEEIEAAHLQDLRVTRAEKHLNRLQSMLEDMAALNVDIELERKT
jgi:predicted patatin/cPLA2 family phospholipase